MYMTVRITTTEDRTIKGRVQDVDGEGVALHGQFFAYFEIERMERWESGANVLSGVGDFLGETVRVVLAGALLGGLVYAEVEYDAVSTGVEFHLSHGDMIRLLRSAGFDVLDLIELYIPPDATSRYRFVDHEWGGQWPIEEVWVAERRIDP